ncbi:MAG: FtsW/RodA/SpoVE family cell cycle protein, partial [Clostridia bacterium]|nr:FtsW/RodA/SpoVE family cell cycle protein [Clostridia bacterium]
AGLILLEKHVSATLIICAIAFLMMVIGGTKLRYFVSIGTVGVVGLACLLMFSDRFTYALNRVKGWIDPFNPPEGVDTWQTRQSLYAIGSGQLFGVGIGQSRQKYLYLPEPQNDFVFAIICEELGFIGALLVIILFALFIWRGVYIALNARDRFGMMLGIGITFQFGLQAVLNICVVTNTIPNTGISLPFFSYGGTALLMLLAEMGVLLSISRHSRIDKT